MALHQNTSVDSDILLVGNWKIETAASVAGTYQNVGLGGLTAWNHEVEMYDTQAANGPDPIEGIASEKLSFSFDAIEFDPSVFSALSGGLLTHTTSTVSTLYAGGNTVLTSRAIKLTQRRLIGGASPCQLRDEGRAHQPDDHGQVRQ